jgi:hypothetical protein
MPFDQLLAWAACESNGEISEEEAMSRIERRSMRGRE